MSISEKFNDLADFIGRSSIEGLKDSPEYLAVAKMIEEGKDQVKSITDRNKKAIARGKVNKLEEELNQMLVSNVNKVDDWILDGIKLWISTFLPNRINFRVYPFIKSPTFQILCNLKRNSFVDQDLEHLLYGYGTQPNIKLSIFGLITSIPPKEENGFDPMSEFDSIEESENERGFEQAMRAMFGAMDGLENFSRYSRYPNITVHPLAVYREIESEEQK